MRSRFVALAVVLVVALAIAWLLRETPTAHVASPPISEHGLVATSSPSVEARGPSATVTATSTRVATKAPQLHEQPPATLVGTVRDAASGLTVETCEVQSPAGSVECDHDGRFVLQASSGEVPLVVASAHHVARQVVAELAAGSRAFVDVALDAAATVHGVVRDPDGRPFAGALVRATAVRLGARPSAEASATSAANGEFVLDGVARGRVAITASAPGFAEARAEVVVTEGTTSEVELQLSTGGAVVGTVVDASGHAVSGATVEAVRLADRATVAHDTSAGDGGFRLDGLADDNYAVSAEVNGLRALASGVRVRAREETNVRLVLGSDVVTGHVKDANGRPVVGAAVQCVSSYSADESGSTTATATDGSFRFDGLAGPPYRIVATLGRSVVEKRGVHPGDEVQLVLPSTGTLEGTVVDANGRAVEDVDLRVWPTDATSGAAGRTSERTLLAPDGRFRMELPVGHYEVRAASREAPEDSESAEIDAGQTTEVSLTLPSPISVTGVVRSAKGPEANCRITAQAGGSELVATPDDPALRETTSDDAGTFTLAPLAPGFVVVRASCPDHQSGAAWTRAQNETNAVTVRTRPSDDDGLDFGGIGATLSQNAEGFAVLRALVPDGPAYEAGLAPGDAVMAIDGATARGLGLQGVVDRVRGPEGTPVTLEVARAGAGTFTTVVERQRIALP